MKRTSIRNKFFETTYVQHEGRALNPKIGDLVRVDAVGANFEGVVLSIEKRYSSNDFNSPRTSDLITMRVTKVHKANSVTVGSFFSCDEEYLKEIIKRDFEKVPFSERNLFLNHLRSYSHDFPKSIVREKKGVYLSEYSIYQVLNLVFSQIDSRLLPDHTEFRKRFLETAQIPGVSYLGDGLYRVKIKKLEKWVKKNLCKIFEPKKNLYQVWEKNTDEEMMYEEMMFSEFR
jgi:hypothetical protein